MHTLYLLVPVDYYYSDYYEFLAHSELNTQILISIEAQSLRRKRSYWLEAAKCKL